jgi:hypothetical protein
MGPLPSSHRFAPLFPQQAERTASVGTLSGGPGGRLRVVAGSGARAGAGGGGAGGEPPPRGRSAVALGRPTSVRFAADMGSDDDSESDGEAAVASIPVRVHRGVSGLGGAGLSQPPSAAATVRVAAPNPRHCIVLMITTQSAFGTARMRLVRLSGAVCARFLYRKGGVNCCRKSRTLPTYHT